MNLRINWYNLLFWKEYNREGRRIKRCQKKGHRMRGFKRTEDYTHEITSCTRCGHIEISKLRKDQIFGVKITEAYSAQMGIDLENYLLGEES